MSIKVQDGIHLMIRLKKELYCPKLTEDQYKTFGDIFVPLFTDITMTDSTDNGTGLKNYCVGVIYDKFLFREKIDKDLLIDKNVDKLKEDDYIVVYNEGGYLQPLKLTDNQKSSLDNLMDLLFNNPDTGELELIVFDDPVGCVRDEFI